MTEPLQNLLVDRSRCLNAGTKFSCFSRWESGLLAGWILLQAIAVHGQEALRSALALDAVVRTQENASLGLRPEQPHLGPVQLQLGTYVGAEFDDNINTSQSDPQSDTILRAGLSLGFTWPATGQSELRLSSDVGYATYLSHTRNDTVEISPGSVLSWNILFEDGSVTFFDQFNYSQAVNTLASVSGVSQIPRFDNTVGTRIQWRPDRWQFEFSYSHNDYFSPDSAFDYLNRASEYFSLRGARCLAEDTQVGLEASVSFTDYELPIQSDNRSYSLGPYLEWQVTHFLSARIRGGPTFYSFDSVGQQPSSSLSTYYADLNLTHQLTEFISQQLSVRRDVSLGINKSSDFTEQLTASYSVHWAARRYLDLGLSLIYENGTQPLNENLVSMTEDFSRLGVSPSISYQFTEKLSGSINYSHWERDSNISGNNYSENSIALRLSYDF